MITNFKTKDNMGIITTINITFSAYLEQDYQPDALQAILCTISTLVPAKYSRVTDEFGGICQTRRFFLIEPEEYERIEANIIKNEKFM
jgi:hypothetical protein